jgi:hypothetical protein
MTPFEVTVLSVTLNAAGIVAFGYSVDAPLTKLRFICIMCRNQNKGLAAWKYGINLIWQEITAA